MLLRTLFFVASPLMATAQTAVTCVPEPEPGAPLAVPLRLIPRAPAASMVLGGAAGCAVRTPVPEEASQDPRRDALYGLPPPDLARVLPETTE